MEAESMKYIADAAKYLSIGICSLVMIAVAKWLVEDSEHAKHTLVETMQKLGRSHPDRGYGGNFRRWLFSSNPMPYNSWGNGSAMRVSPVGLYAKKLSEALELAKISAEVTHNHPEGLKGAQAIAASVFLAKEGLTKSFIKKYIARKQDLLYQLSHEQLLLQP